MEIHSDTVRDIKTLLRLAEELVQAHTASNHSTVETRRETGLTLAKAIGRVEGQATILRIRFEHDAKHQLVSTE